MAERVTADGPVEGRWPLPDGWSWRRARDLGRIVGGSTPKNASDSTNYCNDGTPWLTPADVAGKKIDLDRLERLLASVDVRIAHSAAFDIAFIENPIAGPSFHDIAVPHSEGSVTPCCTW